MTTPKPEMAWAVFDLDGKLLMFTITGDQIGAENRCSNFRSKDWADLEERGYRCLPVEIKVKK